MGRSRLAYGDQGSAAMEAFVIAETTAVLLAGFGWAAVLYTWKLQEVERHVARVRPLTGRA
jgi:hypothetical protein